MLKGGIPLNAPFGVKRELSRLGQLEQVIERGKQSFIEVGKALEEIRDKDLYKDKYGTFEEYCQRRWGFGRQYGYRIIIAAKEAEKLPEPERPKTEREMRNSLEIRQNLVPVGTIQTKDKGVTKPDKEVSKVLLVFDMTREEHRIAQNVLERIGTNWNRMDFVQALNQWLEDSGL